MVREVLATNRVKRKKFFGLTKKLSNLNRGQNFSRNLRSRSFVSAKSGRNKKTVPGSVEPLKSLYCILVFSGGNTKDPTTGQFLYGSNHDIIVSHYYVGFHISGVGSIRMVAK